MLFRKKIIDFFVFSDNCRGRLLKIAPILVQLLSQYGTYNTTSYTQHATLNHCCAVLAALSNDGKCHENDICGTFPN